MRRYVVNRPKGRTRASRRKSYAYTEPFVPCEQCSSGFVLQTVTVAGGWSHQVAVRCACWRAWREKQQGDAR